MLIIAVWTLIEDGLPIVFRQNRIGYKGKTFRLSKFRSLKNIDEKISSKCVRGGDHESGEEFRNEGSNGFDKQPTTNNQQQKSHSDFNSGEEFRDVSAEGSNSNDLSSRPSDSERRDLGFSQQDCHPEPAEGSKSFNQQQTTNNKQQESQSDSHTPNDGIEQRVLKIGKITRKTRLDETLQFWNVLNGTMSIVGSRPEMEEFHKEMKEKIPYYAYRLDTNPGITGWAQINYKHTTTLEDYRKKTEYDLYYVKNRTLLLDIQIMLKTVETMFGMRGAR
jgi:lipopolysaccharide/colanic/teichoic acid biosynthesis glycosyltransferase